MALIPKDNLEINRITGAVQIKAKTLIDAVNMCSSSRFSNQTMLANCSGSLISKDVVLTAAHCFETCDEYYYVFDYEVKNESGEIEQIKAKNIYECKKTIHHNFDQTFTKTGIDLSLVKLTRPVLDRKPHSVTPRKVNIGEEIFMIGYPLGVAKKVSHNAFVDNKTTLKNSFSSNLDTFSVNSGSPIFARDTGSIIGVLVRGTGTNFLAHGQCNDWSVGTEEGYADANDLLSIKEMLTKLQK